MLRQAVAPVEFRHLIIHQHDVWPMPAVSVDGLQSRADNLHHLMLAEANKPGQRRPDAFLVVRNQDAHTAIAELSMPAVSASSKSALQGSRPRNLCRDPLGDLRQESRFQVCFEADPFGRFGDLRFRVRG